MDKLEPCPFCGGEAKSYTGIDRDWEVFCNSEDCNAALGYYPTEAEAIAAWNTRAGAASTIAGERREPVARAIYHASCAQLDEGQPAWEQCGEANQEAYREMADAALREAATLVRGHGDGLREALEMIANHVRDESMPYESDYWGCVSIARQALGGNHG